ncbi:MAG: sodium:alanine symporter family protein, partial [Candidatus Marinimicrobia bacterium]|nr:sodium:alanine symporter family protein [Candidatus Neomarinimicrobiota bacterium]
MSNSRRSVVVIGIVALLLIMGGVDFFNKVWVFPGNFEFFSQFLLGRIPLMVYLLLGTGIFMAYRLGFIQLRKLKHSFEVISGKYDHPDDEGDLTHFQALSAALSATVGIGNIAGVATAIHYGGPGALFWMWVTALFGMGLKFSECTLSMVYRKVHADGSVSGGPMYYIENGLGPRFKWLAIAFAVFGVICSFGTGNSIQAFTVSDQIYNEVANLVANPDTHFLTRQFQVVGAFHVSLMQIFNGLMLSTIVALVIIGGIKRIGLVASRLAPFMAVFYVTAATLILLANYDQVIPVFGMIFTYAFNPPAEIAGVAGGSLLVIFNTMMFGVKRGLFSNESGQGSAAIAHATAKTKYPVREGIVAMSGPFIDTLIICTMTGLVIISTGAWHHTAFYLTNLDPSFSGEIYNSSVLTAYAFKTGLAWLFDYGDKIVTMGVFLFAISTAISWSYYGDRCAEYLWGKKAIPLYRWGFVIAHFIGAIA